MIFKVKAKVAYKRGEAYWLFIIYLLKQENIFLKISFKQSLHFRKKKILFIFDFDGRDKRG